ncbi:toprim domain-containing protein [Kushneria phosphatilytica]|uniref:toprim domain-containing protein n=1 Tax=Kushneria phosphatilytica TaxID=657387 RepID=UPI000A7DB025|nr:toprim domain-containing protein [Kushneria phosphatilytica]
MAEHATVAKIRQVAMAALTDSETLLRELLPEGRRSGSEWIARNVARGDQSPGSFGVSLVSGKWNDFADSAAHGGDLVSLYGYLHRCRQVDAAMAIDRLLGLGIFQHGAGVPHPAPQDTAVSDREAWLARQKRIESERAEARAHAAERARQCWDSARPAASTHPYLIDRGVPAYNLRQSKRGWLLVPLYHQGELVNVQSIMPNGGKRFLKGGRVQGCYAPIGEPRPFGKLFICEGWATGATLHRLTGEPVVCAMHAGNLAAVARAMRPLCDGSLELIIAGDDDRHTEGNPGRTAANDAALAVGAMVLYPKWPEGCPDDLTDFNDLYRWHRRQLAHGDPTDLTGGDR